MVDFSSYLHSASAMISEPLKTLWHDPTFTNFFRTLPTVLTSSLFMVFWFIGVAMACVKWTLFLLIMAMAYVLGWCLLLITTVVLVIAYKLGLEIRPASEMTGLH